MKVFITGASGYIGGSVAKTLVDAGHTVYGLIRNQEKVAALQQLGVEPVLGTLNDADILIKFAQR
ncbi:NmrA family NAD(P)-binding protein, partial [Paenibacillus sp. AR247]